LSEKSIESHINDPAQISEQVSHRIQQNENKVQLYLDSITRFGTQNLNQIQSFTNQYFDQAELNHINVFLYENDSLFYWSNNQVNIDNNLAMLTIPRKFVLLDNGYYLKYDFRKGNQYAILLYLIKHRYPLKNKYLQNSFNPNLNIPDVAEPDTVPHENAFSVNDANGKFLFSLKIEKSEKTEVDYSMVTILLFIGIILFLIFCYTLARYCIQVWPAGALLVVVMLASLRLLGIFYKLPAAFYLLPLFDPKFYASSFMLSSLGDFLVTTMVSTLIILIVHRYFENLNLSKAHLKRKIWLGLEIVLIFLACFLFSVFINYLISGLILNSLISFNINNVFELTDYSLIGFIIIGLWLFSFYLISDGAVRFVQKTKFSIQPIVVFFLLTQCAFLIVLLWLRETDMFRYYGVSSFLLANALIIFTSYIRSREQALFSFTRSLLVILVFSLYASKTIADFNNIKEERNRQIYASKMEVENDLVAEYLFEDIQSKIITDRFVATYLIYYNQRLLTESFVNEAVGKRLMQLYFNGYWDKYSIKVNLYSYNQDLIGLSEEPSESFSHFENIISVQGSECLSPNLYYLGSTEGRLQYIGKLPVYTVSQQKTVQVGTIIIRIASRKGETETGFPELLLSDKVPDKKDLSNYSYAKFENGKLIGSTGKYSYLQDASHYEKHLVNNQRLDTYFEESGYSHLIHPYGLNNLIVISKQHQNVVVLLTLFSYIFTFFCLIFILSYTVYKLIKNRFKFHLSLKNRIQLSVTTIVLAALVALGSGTVIYIVNNNQINQNQRVSESLQSLVVLISNELNALPEGKHYHNEEVQASLNKLASATGLEYNIFGLDGFLQFTSQPRLFDYAIQNRLMNRKAYEELHNRKNTRLTHFEKIGALDYISAYEPLRNLQGDIVSYVNLPYITRQSNLRKEISSFLVTLINIYVFLFAFSLIATFIISGRITEPLQVIQQRLSEIRLGSVNEPIVYKQRNEIGGLVNEYNRMLEELHQSAEKLARSERESAWREMAKQVAHEIKNPLTPMKLNVQHLERAWSEKSGNLEQMIPRICKTLIEQMDTLSGIATEFSNFAKMPKPNIASVELSSLLDNLVTLYNESELIYVVYESNEFKDKFVEADRDQLISVFSNLLKNAEQAIPSNRKGMVHIHLEKRDRNYIISVRDNGSGIKPDQYKRIFTPNFTTKSAGTGLGLSISKKFVESTGGEIWFESEHDIGTTFFVKLPMPT